MFDIRINAFVSIILIALVSLLGVASAAVEPETENREPSETTDNGALQSQLDWYASRYEVSTGEAARRDAVADAAAKTAERLASKYPDDFAGAWIDHEPMFSVTIAFKANVPLEERGNRDPCERSSDSDIGDHRIPTWGRCLAGVG